MPRFLSARRIAVVAAIGFAGAALALSASAAQSVAVTFEPNSAWAQEVGKVSSIDSSHDYTVAIPAGKTFQVNLLTRDPNVFFTIRNDTDRKKLVDTMKTGATTWSTETTAPANYTVHVYVEPAAMPHGKVADFALQIGRYGKEDMQPAATTVAFADNAPWAQVIGTLNATGASHDYLVAIDPGTTLQVNLVTRDSGMHFQVDDQASGAQLVDTAKTGATTWSVPTLTTTNYKVRVYVDPASVPPGKETGFALQIGHYPSADTGTVVPPSATSTAGHATAPASGASAAAPAPASDTHD